MKKDKKSDKKKNDKKEKSGIRKLLCEVRKEMSKVKWPNKKDMGKYYDDIIKTKPGLTGYWQVSGRSDVSFKKRLELEQYYSNNFSFRLDVKIVFKTVKVVLRMNGAE